MRNERLEVVQLAKYLFSTDHMNFSDGLSADVGESLKTEIADSTTCLPVQHRLWLIN